MNIYNSLSRAMAPIGYVLMPTKIDRSELHDLQVQIGDKVFLVLFYPEITSRRYQGFKCNIMEVCMHRGDVEAGEWVTLPQLSIDTYEKLEAKCQEWWDKIMPYDFFEDGEDCPVNDDTKMY